jgi:hypothetical protein
MPDWGEFAPVEAVVSSLGFMKNSPSPADSRARASNGRGQSRQPRPENLPVVARCFAGGFLTVMPSEPFLCEADRHLHGADRNGSTRTRIGLCQSRPHVLRPRQFQIVKPSFGLLWLAGRPSARLVLESIFDHLASEVVGNRLGTACYHFATQLPNIGRDRM